MKAFSNCNESIFCCKLNAVHGVARVAYKVPEQRCCIKTNEFVFSGLVRKYLTWLYINLIKCFINDWFGSRVAFLFKTLRRCDLNDLTNC